MRQRGYAISTPIEAPRTLGLAVRVRVPSDLVEAVVVIAAFAVAALAFWLGVFVPRFRPGAGTWGTLDLAAYFYPKFTYGAEAIREGRIPLWNPHEFCGMPFLATAQVAALYPVKNLVFWLFSPPLALHANYVVHLTIAGVSTWAYGRWLGLAPPAAAVAGLLWAFHDSFVDSVYHPNRIMVLSWVPLVFLLYERALARRTLGAAALAGAVIALDISAGYPGFTLCLGAFLTLAALFHTLRAWRTGASPLGVLVRSAAVAVFAAAFAAPQILPLAELVGETSRRETLLARETYLLTQPLGASALLHAALGAIGHLRFYAPASFALAFVGVVFGRRQLGWLFAASLVLVFAGSYLQPLPGFDLLRQAWNLWGTFADFFEGMLIALGLDAVVRRYGRTWLIALLLLGLPVLAAIHGAAWGLPFALPVGLLVGVTALAARARPALASVAAALVAVLFVAGTLGSVPYRMGAEPYPARLPDPELQRWIKREGRSRRVFAPSLVRVGDQMLSRLPVVTGYESSLRPERIGALLDATGLRDSLVGLGPDWAKIGRNRHLLDLLGVSLMVSPWSLNYFGFRSGPTLPDGNTAYRNPTALPRVFIVHRIRAVATAEEAYAAVVDPRFRPREEAVVEGQAPPASTPALLNDFVFTGVELDEPEHLRVGVLATAPGLLVVTDSWFPGWEAYEGDLPRPILRVNYAFRGIAIEPGSHKIDFVYRPRGFRAGVTIAAVAAAVAFAAMLHRRLRNPA